MICKLNIEKDFDNLNWQFLLKVVYGTWPLMGEVNKVVHFHSQVLGFN